MQHCCKTIRKGNIARFTTHVETCIAVNQVAACKLHEYWLWLDKIMCYVTCCKTSLPLAGKTYSLCKFCWKKVEILSTLCNNVLQPAGGWVVVRQVWTWVVKRTVFFVHFCCPFYWSLRVVSIKAGLHILCSLFNDNYRLITSYFWLETCCHSRSL